MGTIKFTYRCDDVKLKPEEIIAEIEYGASFVLNTNDELAIFPAVSKTKWINDYTHNYDTLILQVDDSFFDDNMLFEKIFTTFIFNLMDFGKLQLVNIDFSKSFILNKFTEPIYEFSHKPILGTILKPYYQSLEQKLELVSSLCSSGLQVFKEDETYLVSKDTLIEHAIAIQNLLQDRGCYIPNITPYVSDHEYIEKLIDQSGVQIVLVNFLVTGLGDVYRLKKAFPGLGIWGHRVGYLAVQDQLSIHAISQLAIAAGIDFLHIGTPTNQPSWEEKKRLICDLQTIKQCKAVFTKTSENSIRFLVKQFSKEAVFLACGSLKKNDGISFDKRKINRWVKSAHNG